MSAGKALNGEVLSAIEKKRASLGNPVWSKQKVSENSSDSKCLLIIHNMVFDVTSFLREHPGGSGILRSSNGKEATDSFMRTHSLKAQWRLVDMFVADVGKVEKSSVKEGTAADASMEKHAPVVPALKLPDHHPAVNGMDEDMLKQGGGCPFMALAALQESKEEDAESADANENHSNENGMSGGVYPKPMGESMKSLRSEAKTNGSFTSSFAMMGMASTSPRSIRSRESRSVKSRNTASSYSKDNYSQSDMSRSNSRYRGTNLNKAGGVYRPSRHRKRNVNVKFGKAPPVDMGKWIQNSGHVVASWNKVLKSMSYTEIGSNIYSSVRDNDQLEPLFRFTNSSVQGTKFVDMLSSIVENIQSPASIYVKIAELAPMHHRKGVKGSQMPMMKDVVLGVFRTALGDDFLPEERRAWSWMWNYLSEALEQSLKDVGSTLSIVRDCWDVIMEHYEPSDLGEMVYDHLFRLAPNVASLFTQPRVYMAVKMGDMLGMLVSFADDPDNMKQQVSCLGLRHVKYRVRPHHIPLMGPVFMSVLSEAAGPEWTPEVEKAWGVVFSMVCESMSEAIQDGENFAGVMEESVKFLEEPANQENLLKILRAELSVTCPSIFEELLSLSMLKINGGMDNEKGKRQKKEKGSMMFGNANNASEVSHLLNVSAQKKPQGNENGNGQSANGGKQNRSILGIAINEEAVEELVKNILGFIMAAAKLVWEPEQQIEQVYIFAPRLYRWGMRAPHVSTVGEAFENAAKATLGKERWTALVNDSFRWYWRSISKALSGELLGFESKRNEVVMLSWETVKQRTDVEELGRIFWKHLNDLSPEQTHLFRRSLKMWGHLIHHIMAMLMTSISDPEGFFEQLFELTIRHIRYGVRSEYLGPFGNALICTVQEILGDTWSDRANGAWLSIWKRAANSISKGLNMGGNAITHALVGGNVDALQAAIGSAPRNLRAEWLCQIDINGAVISPLYWALHDGKYAIAEFILSDLLTIRADIHGYYYGREELFKHHEDIVGKLGRECIGLLPVLFDGLLWHSKEKLQGRKIRVNYYIRDLYGDPDLEKDPWNSPLAWLVNLDDNESFKHPAVRKTLQLKWEGFGLKIFCLKEISYFLMLLTFMLGHVRDPSSCDKNYLGTRIVLLIIAICTLAVQILMIASQLKRKLMLPVTIGKFTIHLPRGLVGLWNILRIVTCVIIIVAFANQSCDTIDCSVDPNATECLGMNLTRRELSLHLLAAKAKADSSTTKSSLSSFNYAGQTALAIAAVLLWVQMFQLSILSTPMAAFTYTIGIMFGDLSHSLFMILILMAAFGSALTIIGDAPFDQGWDRTIVLLLQEVLGVAQPLYSDISSFTRFLLLFFVICVTIGMLNILIAQLTITYDKLTADKEGFAMKHRASTCLEIESFIPMSWRRKIFCDLAFHIPLSFSDSDEGPSGGVQAIERDVCPRYVPDRIMRFTGDASPNDPWPSIHFQDKSLPDKEKENN
mmetsp:Transcript_2496/g.5982  ORF Transcript_2496/g.5982 Transcript_2496/m.5982 type:complete len:1471 (-) Transcript_2496:34-4446(-)